MNQSISRPEEAKVRVLVVHNSYRQRGGEDNVVDAEVGLLQTNGHEVAEYRRHSDETAGMGALALGVQSLWSKRTARDIARLAKQFDPHLVHVHNTFPLISPSVYWSAYEANLPVVQTLHNFRLICLQATLLRGGHVCEDCVGRLPWRGVVWKCYHDSATESAALAGVLGMHRRLHTYRNKITRYVALSDFSRRKFIEGGFPAERIVVKPNFADVRSLKQSKRVGGLFVGRLSQEKGIEVLLEAVALCPGVAIRVMGSGPEEHKLRSNPRIILLGWRSRTDVLDGMSSARYLVMPSLCYENFPLAIVEAFACGLPVITSRLGAMADLIQDGQTGLLFTPGSAEDLAAKIMWAEANHQRMHEMGRIARAVYEAKYTPESNYAQLRRIYVEAICARHGIPHDAENAEGPSDLL